MGLDYELAGVHFFYKVQADDVTLVTPEKQSAGELLFLGLPTRDLCREGCRGLCPKCGKNLNEGDCGCDRKEIDPRLAVLKKFLDTDQ